MSWPRNRSLSGYLTISSASSPIRPTCLPSWSSRSRQSCHTAIRRSSNCVAAARTMSLDTPSIAGPRHSASAERSSRAASPRSPSSDARAPLAARLPKWKRSTASSGTCMEYPGGCVTTISFPSSRRSAEIMIITWLLAVLGGLSAHSASTSRSTETTWFACRRSITRTISCRDAARAARCSSMTISTGPSSRNCGTPNTANACQSRSALMSQASRHAFPRNRDSSTR